jgi:glycosyltransferase involved in cell wall biosynthesis
MLANPRPHRPLRVLMVTGAYPTRERPHWGTFIKGQVESLVAAGVDVDVIHPAAGPMPRRYAAAAAGVLSAARRGRFDLVHGHYGLWCLPARAQWRLPVVASFLGTDVLGRQQPAGVHRWKGGLELSVSHWVAHHVDAVIVQSEEMKRVLAGCEAEVLPYGVDFGLFRPIGRAQARAELGWEPDGCYVLFGNDPGRFEKGFPLAQAAVERLRARGARVELVVASGLEQDLLVRYINASNVLLLTSFHEGSPSGVKEVMACNVPVVSTDVGDVSAVIGGTRGCFVCPHDPDALATALQAALRHEGPTTGRADVAHLERSILARRVIAVYERVLGRRAASGGEP